MSRAAMTALINAEAELRNKGKEIARAGKKLKQKEDQQEKKLEELMKSGDEELINMMAETLVNTGTERRNAFKSQVRMEIFADKMKMARLNHSMNASMVAVSKALGRVTASMQLDKIEAIMSDLGRQYEDLDVMSEVMNRVNATHTATSVSPEAVELVKRKAADRAGLELSQDLNSPGVVTAPINSGPTPEQENDIADRLKALRQLA